MVDIAAKEAQWERTHEKLLAAAASLLRERGLYRSTVADAMKRVGLTVGGFYGHFASKEAMFDQVLRQSYRAMWKKLLFDARGETSRDRVVSVLRTYLSRSHRDLHDTGCPLPATISEVIAVGDPYQATLANELDEFATDLGKMAGPLGGRKLALGLLALMVGGLSLARATSGTPLSDSILEASRSLAYLAIGHTKGKRS